MGRPRGFDEADVLHRAMLVFWDKGYEATSLPDLMQATGLGKSSLYGAFGDKRSLFLAALDTYRQERMERLRGALAGERSARDAIGTFVLDVATRSEVPEHRYGCMSCNEAVEFGPRDAEVRRLVAADFEGVEDAFAEAIARGQAEGSITNPEKPRRLARYLTVALQGLHVMARAEAPVARLEDAAHVLLATLDAPAPAPATNR